MSHPPIPDTLDSFFEPETIAAQALFPTPLISACLSDADRLNAALAATILAREPRERGVSVSNRGGWHSAELQSWCGDAGNLVLDAARHLVDHMTEMRRGDTYVPAKVGWCITAWANIHRAGDSNQPHAHAGAVWSGIYWIDDGDAEGGLLAINDPRGILPSMVAPDLRCAITACHGAGLGTTITPKSGTMILFPSWLVHAVLPYAGPRPRLSIAFNFALS